MSLILLFDAESAWIDKESFDVSLNLISEPIQKQVEAFYHYSDKKLALGSQLLQHYYFAQQYSLPWTSIKFIREKGYKPIIDSDTLKNVDYNISHHSGLVVLASRDDGKRVGIDLVHITLSSEFTDWLLPFRQFFTELELRFIESGPKKKLFRFYQVWSLKESFVKGLGSGLIADIQSIEFRDICDWDYWNDQPRHYQNAAHVYQNGVRLNWTFIFYHLRHLHLVAVAYENPPPQNADQKWVTVTEFHKQFEK